MGASAGVKFLSSDAQVEVPLSKLQKLESLGATVESIASPRTAGRLLDQSYRFGAEAIEIFDAEGTVVGRIPYVQGGAPIRCRAPAGSYELAFEHENSGLAESSERIGAKYFRNWNGSTNFKNVEVLSQMLDASKIHFTTKGLSREGGGILDHAFNARPINNKLHNFPGKDAEMGIALQLNDLNDVPLIKKTMFHDGLGGHMTAEEFIRKELAAGNVKTEAVIQWLRGILSKME